MIFALIGHRGAGKSSLLKRIKEYEPESVCVDLDLAISKFENLSIDEIFQKKGEEYFRELEHKILKSLVKNYSYHVSDIWISLGAGFTGELPENVYPIWVRRELDAKGRIFLDRPRLNPELSSLNEYLERFEDRQKNYSKLACEVLTLREGALSANSEERAFFSETMSTPVGAYLCLYPETALNPYFLTWLERRKSWGYSAFELRTDLFEQKDLDQILESMLKIIAPQNILLSFRNKFHTNWIDKGLKLDWDLRLGPCPFLEKLSILSWHSQEGKNLNQDLHDFENCLPQKIPQGVLLKAALVCQNYEELIEGHKWAFQNEERNFLPITPPGRSESLWSWYRLWLKGRKSINFIREGHAGVSDQPILLEWLAHKNLNKQFAALLGMPIQHSISPVEHKKFFSDKHMPYFAIPVNLELLKDQKVIPFLKSLGLSFASVTSPLKNWAFQYSSNRSARAQKLESANTLAFEGDEIFSENTDFSGMKEVLEDFYTEDYFSVWGGGGVSAVLEKLLPPTSSFYSARTGQLKKGPGVMGPQVLIWAAPPQSPMPPYYWQAHTVIDLNYTMDSQAREYALLTGAKYISGLKMFYRQAAEQRLFWQEYL